MLYARRGLIRALGRKGHRAGEEKTVGQSRQTLESIQSDFDRIALLSNDNWNHNTHYQEYLISQIPERCRHILEIGCGTGKFSRLLAQRAEQVLAID